MLLTRVIFLDIDGVLNSTMWDAKCSVSGDDLSLFDPKAAIRMIDVCQQTDAKIVLSSSWRFFPDYVEKLKKAGLPIIDATPREGAFGCRADEIRSWLAAHPSVAFVIVDDEPDAGYGLEDRFVQTDARVGLTAEDCAKIVGLFT